MNPIYGIISYKVSLAQHQNRKLFVDILNYLLVHKKNIVIATAILLYKLVMPIVK